MEQPSKTLQHLSSKIFRFFVLERQQVQFWLAKCHTQTQQLEITFLTNIATVSTPWVEFFVHGNGLDALPPFRLASVPVWKHFSRLGLPTTSWRRFGEFIQHWRIYQKFPEATPCQTSLPHEAGQTHNVSAKEGISQAEG